MTAILDLLYFDPAERAAVEATQRPSTIRLRDAEGREFEIRDQKPLSITKLASCLTDMTVTEWLQLLNLKVFFWPTEERVNDLLGAREYQPVSISFSSSRPPRPLPRMSRQSRSPL